MLKNRKENDIDRTTTTMIEKFTKDLVNKVIEEEVGPLIRSEITESMNTLTDYIRQMIREEIAERTILC